MEILAGKSDERAAEVRKVSPDKRLPVPGGQGGGGRLMNIPKTPVSDLEGETCRRGVTCLHVYYLVKFVEIMSCTQIR